MSHTALLPGARVDRFPFDAEVIRTAPAKGFFRVAPFRYLGTELNLAARLLDASGDSPLQTAKGLVLVLVMRRRAVGHIVVMSVEDGRKRAAAWLKGRAGGEVFLGEAVGSKNGRILYRLQERLFLQELAKMADELFGLIGIAKQGDPTSPAEFDRIVENVRSQLARAAAGEEKAVLRSITRTLARRTSPETLTSAVNEALRRFNRVPGAIGRRQTIILRTLGEAIIRDTSRNLSRRHGFDIESTFTAFDARIGQHLRDSHVNFVRDEFGNRADSMSEVARKIIDRGQAQGLGVGQIRDDVIERLGVANVLRSASYWDTVASAFVNRSRTFASLGMFQRAGVQRFRVTSVLDEDTTDICRFMDGKILSVDKAIKNFEEQAALEDPLELKRVNPWIRVIRVGDTQILATRPPTKDGKGRDTNPLATIAKTGIGTQSPGNYTNQKTPSQIQAQGVNGPPYHGKCRTDLVPA